jgi:hypothetical protein
VTLDKPAPEAGPVSGLTGPDLLRRALLVLVTTLLVARPIVLGEDPGQTDSLSDPWGMVLTLLWLVAAAGWAAWRFWLRPRTRPDGTIEGSAGEGPPPWNWYGGIVQTILLAIVAVVFLSAEFAAHYKFPARLIAWEWLGLFLAFFVVRQLAVTPAEQSGLFAVLLAGAVSLAAHGVYQYFIELPNTRAEVGPDLQSLREALARRGILDGEDEGMLLRFYRRLQEDNIFGPYAHPNSYAGYLVLWLPGLVGAVAVCRQTRAPNWQTLLAGGCAVLGGAALWLTHSRGAMLGLVLAGLGVIVLLWRRSLRTHWIAALAGLLLLVGLAYGAGRGGLLTTVMGKGAGTVTLRLEYWRTTWRIICERPWLGVGPGNFRESYTRFLPETAEETIKDPHNFVLEMWATCGVFAMILLLAVLAAFFFQVVRWLGGWVVEDATTQPPNHLTTQLPNFRWDFYLGGMFGLLLSFVLRVNAAAPEEILSEAWAAGLRSVVWFAAYGLLERVAWSDRGRALALTAGVAALLVNLSVSGGIAFPSVAGPLWVAVALALNARSLEPTPWLSRPGVAVILPLPILVAVALGYSSYVLYPVLTSDGLQREAVLDASFFRTERRKPPDQQAQPIRDKPIPYVQQKIIEPLAQASRLTPDDARLHVQLARWNGLLWELKWLETKFSDPDVLKRAIGHAVRAARLDPDGGQGYWAEYHVRMQLAAVNEEVAHKGPNRDPAYVNTLQETARKQFRLAANALERHLPNDLADTELRFQIARAYFRAGDTEKGRQQAEEAQRLDEAAPPRRKLTDPQREQLHEWLRPAAAG